MTKKITLLLLGFIVCQQLIQAQPINISHQFQGTTVFDISFGGGKFGWVTFDNSQTFAYTYHYMDTLQNIISVNDVNLTHPQIASDYGDDFITSKMDNYGHLWGLFYDAKRFQQLFPLGLGYDTCNYYVYDFDNHQRHYLNLKRYDRFLLPGYDSSWEMIFKNDTLVIDFFCRESIFWPNLSPSNYCVKWANGTVLSEGTMSNNYGYCRDVFIDYNNVHNVMFADYGGNISWQQTEGIYNGVPVSYQQTIPTPVGFHPNLFLDAAVSNDKIYCLGASDDTSSSMHKILIRDNAGDTSINTSINYAGWYWNTGKIAVDHANRIWVYRYDSVYMYNGNWSRFSLQGNAIYPQQPVLHNMKNIRFFEYATNKFAVGFSNQETWNEAAIGDGMLLFEYNAQSNHIQGRVFYDANNNQIYDMGETNMAGQLVYSGSENTNVYPNGLYNLYLPNGTHTVTTVNALPYLIAVPAAHNFNFTAQTDTTGIDFAMQHAAATNDLSIHLTAGLHRTTQPICHAISYKNTGSSAVNGTVTLQFNANMSFTNSNVAPTSNSAGNLTWDFVNLMPFETRQIYLSLSAGTTFNIGDTVYASATITPLIGDVIIDDNDDSTTSVFIGPYDPNIKTVYQNGAQVNTIMNSDALEYVIQFQNVGNDTAFTVIIKDTISDYLDLSTLQIIGSSHNYTWGIYNRTLQFTYTGINLPDSATNNIESNGFVSYRINPIVGINIGSQIDNRAAIYFDNNPPIITNNAQVTFIDVTKASNQINNARTLTLYPNPAQQYLQIRGANLTNQTVSIYDAIGKLVLRSAVTQQHTIDVMQLDKGIYSLQVAGQTLKFVKE